MRQPGIVGNGLSDREEREIIADVYAGIIVWNYLICSWFPGQQSIMVENNNFLKKTNYFCFLFLNK